MNCGIQNSYSWNSRDSSANSLKPTTYTTFFFIYIQSNTWLISYHSPPSLYLSVPCIIFLKRANQCRLYNCTLRATYEENAIPYKYFGCTLFWFCVFSFYKKAEVLSGSDLEMHEAELCVRWSYLEPFRDEIGDETTIIGKKIKLWPNKCALACGGR